MIVDAHQHFWWLGELEYPWLTPALGVLHQDHGPADLEPLLVEAGIDATIIVQAADTAAETDRLLEVAGAVEWVAGIVGWLPLTDPAAMPGELERRLSEPAFRGLRHLLHNEPDPHWVLRDDVQRSLALVAGTGLVYDVPAEFPHHLGDVATVARAHPELPIVIDHLAKPPIRAGGFEPWASALTVAADHDNVHAKLSGLTTAAPEDWDADVLRPYVEHALEVFGPERCIMGSDWPVSRLAGDLVTTWRAQEETLAGLSADERAAVLGGTAMRVYGLGALA